MTAENLRELMFGFANGKANEYEKKLNELGGDARTEKKALTIQKNICENCASFVQIDFGGRYFEVRENVVFGHFNHFDEYRQMYFSKDNDGKKLFITFAYAMMMAYHSFYLPKKELCDTEKDVNALILPYFDDYCTLRRHLISDGFWARDKEIYTVIKKS